jgi:hypothetical protein
MMTYKRAHQERLHTVAKAHPGFKAVQAKIAKKQGVSKERAGAILAAGARKASVKAVKANPRLKKVAGMRQKKG